MPFDIVVASAAGILRARYTGEVGLDQRVSFARRLLDEAERAGIHRWLLDFRGAHARVGRRDDVVRMADELASRIPLDARIAYLMTHRHQVDDEVGGLLRSAGLDVERFVDPGKAVAWLRSDPSPRIAEARAADPDPNRAYRLVADAIAPTIQLSPPQFAALGELAQDLLARGIEDRVIQRIVGRLSGNMGSGRPVDADRGFSGRAPTGQ